MKCQITEGGLKEKREGTESNDGRQDAVEIFGANTGRITILDHYVHLA